MSSLFLKFDYNLTSPASLPGMKSHLNYMIDGGDILIAIFVEKDSSRTGLKSVGTGRYYLIYRLVLDEDFLRKRLVNTDDRDAPNENYFKPKK